MVLIPNLNYLEKFGSIWFRPKPKLFGNQFGEIRAWAKPCRSVPGPPRGGLLEAPLGLLRHVGRSRARPEGVL